MKIDQKNKPFTIVDLEADSPAEAAGLKNGDTLVKVDAIDVKNMYISSLVLLINKALKRGYVDLEIEVPEVIEEPRLCRIETTDGKLGFSLTGPRDTHR